MKLHRKIKHNEKVCRAHDLGSYAQGQGRFLCPRRNFGGILKSNRPSVRPSVTNRVSAISHKLLEQI